MPLIIDEPQDRREPLSLNLNSKGPLSWRGESNPGWVRVKSVMDSGASQSVAPPGMAPGVTIEESPGSKRGQHYISASKERLPNMGQQRMGVTTNEGRHAQVLYQVAEVTRPLTAVSQTCDNGNIVVYGPGGGFIHNMYNGRRTSFGSTTGGIYEIDLWIKAEEANGQSSPGGFARPGF